MPLSKHLVLTASVCITVKYVLPSCYLSTIRGSDGVMKTSGVCHLYFAKWVAGGLLVKALYCGSKGPRFQSHLQQRFISLLGALSPTSKIEKKAFLCVLWRGC